MLTALSAKNKFEFIDSSIQRLVSTDSQYTVWKRCNNMVVSWLVHSVSPLIRQSILWMDNAQEIWKDLESRYSQGDLLRISNLQQEITSIRQGDRSITDYFTRIRIIWDELESYCVCDPKCSCNALTTVFERKKQDRVMQCLRGLNDQFNIVRSNILMMEPLPRIDKVFSYVVQQERQITNNDLLGNTRSRAGLGGFGRGNSNGKGTKVCTHCGFTNHTVDECHKKHGYPPGHKYHKSNGSSINNANVLRAKNSNTKATQNEDAQDIDVRLTSK
uniref:Retrotransposon gag domain-containing protein n=1 Tax=Cajanus cajan TaxID=3821 RepID=A0A151RME7_CAJCA|nr:hypothetical protein KK1_034783 [Cajanus cajan]